MQFRGVVKLVAVALAAGLGGTVIGIGLSELTGGESSGEPAAAQTVAAAPATTAAAPATERATSTVGTQTAVADGPYRVPRVEVLDARLGVVSSTTGRARVRAKIRVTNRNASPLASDVPVLIAGEDEVPLDGGAREAARAVLEDLAPGASVVGSLRFTMPAAVTQRLIDRPRARLRIAKHAVLLQLATDLPEATG